MWFIREDDESSMYINIVFCKDCIYGHFDDRGMINWDLHCPMIGHYEIAPDDYCPNCGARMESKCHNMQ